MSDTPKSSRTSAVAITFVGDYERQAPDGTYVVESDLEYVAACKAIRDLAAAEHPISIWVKGRAHFDWLRDFCNRIEVPCKSSEKTPRLILAEEWGVDIPEWLDDDTVISQNLLDLSITEDHPASFVDTILSHFYSKAFEGRTISSDKIAEAVVAVANPEEDRSVSAYPVAARCLDERVSSWIGSAKQAWLKRVCERLLDDPNDLWKDLTLWRLLGRYPDSLLEYVVPAHNITDLRNVPLEAIEDIEIEPRAQEQALDQVNAYFDEIIGSIGSTKDFESLVGSVSGCLRPEFGWIKKTLASNRFEVTTAEINLVRDKFEDCPYVTEGELLRLQTLVKPPRPDLGGSPTRWDGHRWTKWVVDQYLPYRHWQVLNDHYDAQIEEFIKAFSEWYIQEYVHIHSDEGLSLVHLLAGWREQINADEHSLILLVDCLTSIFWNLLKQALTRVGFHLEYDTYRFAPLPSTTLKSKPLLLAGTYGDHRPDYDRLLRERSEREWDSRATICHTGIGKIEESDQVEEPLIQLVNFRTIDELLHRDVRESGATYEEEAYRIFERLADMAKEAHGRYRGRPGGFTIYVVTDHGACTLLEEDRQRLESRVVDKIFKEQKHRYGSIPRREKDNVPENLWALGHDFVDPLSEDESVYFIPAGHNTVGPSSRVRGYVHGGATPEEVIVPAACFRPVKTTWEEPSIRALDLKPDPVTHKALFYVQRLTTLRIEIRNPNTASMRITHAELIVPSGDIRKIRTAEIEPKGTSTIELDCYFDKSAMTENELLVSFRYEIAGHKGSTSFRLQAVFKSALTPGLDLTKLE